MAWIDGTVIDRNAPVHTATFKSKLRDGAELEDSKLVQIKVKPGLVDMFGRLYPRKMVMWVHHFDEYGVIVEGTYEVCLARKALKKAGYTEVRLWGYRPILINQKASQWPYGLAVGGGSAVAFYFDVKESLG